ncbi:hypothetical protein BRADI_5g08622v3 [Brachypodium distachyon]|uniref:Uncharacterized protein n=1 Tax=Brachypodium distachyon TaxID=15368 RepID=A0A0Q3H2P1_BRADI|nr:hypothetical protein BRADI_5g08622v3 [Brachypodium distachyon]
MFMLLKSGSSASKPVELHYLFVTRGRSDVRRSWRRSTSGATVNESRRRSGLLLRVPRRQH